MRTHTCIYTLTRDTNNANSDSKNHKVHSVFLPFQIYSSLYWQWKTSHSLFLIVYLSNQSSSITTFLLLLSSPYALPSSHSYSHSHASPTGGWELSSFYLCFDCLPWATSCMDTLLIWLGCRYPEPPALPHNALLTSTWALSPQLILP